MLGVVDDIAQQYLDHVTIKADFVSAACPFHQETTPGAFWISRESGSWGCWSCGVHGSDLGSLLEGMKIRAPRVEKVIRLAREERKKTSDIDRVVRAKKARQQFKGTAVLPESLLGVWDWCPVKLLDDGFSEELIRAHDIGFDRARNRITFPIRDIAGQLIGISGRTVIEESPKYKVYQGAHDIQSRGKTVRVKGELGEWFPHYSSTDIRNHLWRGNFVYDKLYDGDDDQLIIVEGYKAALWLVQLGYDNTVALMGARMSKQQERLIRRMGTETWLFLDNNHAGQSGMDDMSNRLGSCTSPVHRCIYPDWHDETAQPDDLSVEEVAATLSNAVRVVGRYKAHAGFR